MATQIEKIKSMDINELSEWLDKYGQFDGSPWMDWWDERYCKNCESVVGEFLDSNREHKFAWCELHDKCRFFEEFDEVPDNKEIIRSWLESEAEGL